MQNAELRGAVSRPSLGGAWEDFWNTAGRVYETVDRTCNMVQSPTTQAIASGTGTQVGGRYGGYITEAAEAAAKACASIPGRAGPAASSRYPKGSVARYHEKERIYWVFPPGSPLSGAQDAMCQGVGCMQGGLGWGLAPVIGKEPAPPKDSVVGSPIKPAYKRWWFWPAVVGGGLAVAGGAFLVLRKR